MIALREQLLPEKAQVRTIAAASDAAGTRLVLSPVMLGLQRILSLVGNHRHLIARLTFRWGCPPVQRGRGPQATGLKSQS